MPAESTMTSTRFAPRDISRTSESQTSDDKNVVVGGVDVSAFSADLMNLLAFGNNTRVTQYRRSTTVAQLTGSGMANYELRGWLNTASYYQTTADRRANGYADSRPDHHAGNRDTMQDRYTNRQSDTLRPSSSAPRQDTSTQDVAPRVHTVRDAAPRPAAVSTADNAGNKAAGRTAANTASNANSGSADTSTAQQDQMNLRSVDSRDKGTPNGRSTEAPVSASGSRRSDAVIPTVRNDMIVGQSKPTSTSQATSMPSSANAAASDASSNAAAATQSATTSAQSGLAGQVMQAIAGRAVSTTSAGTALSAAAGSAHSATGTAEPVPAMSATASAAAARTGEHNGTPNRTAVYQLPDAGKEPDPAMVQRVVRVMRAMIGRQQSFMTAKLSPPELGNVRLDVHLDNSTLTARLQVETTAARDMLASRIDQLRNALESQGIRVQRFDIEVRPQVEQNPTMNQNTGNNQSFAGNGDADPRTAGQAQTSNYHDSQSGRQQQPSGNERSSPQAADPVERLSDMTDVPFRYGTSRLRGIDVRI